MLSSLTTLSSGLLFGFGLIVAIGAQNAFTLREGLLKKNVGILTALCIMSDALLIMLGVAGIGELIKQFPAILEIAKYAGALFLFAYGILSIKRAFKAESLTIDNQTETPLKKKILTLLALTFLNPHVYLDTVILLGTIANTHGDKRWYFATGAILASVIWFLALGYGARLLIPLFKKPKTWKILDILIGLVMFVIAASLLLKPLH